MNSVDTSTATPTASPLVEPGEMRLEVVVLAVSDVDRAKRFYEGLGWRLDADLVVDDGYRVVQVTPPGSGCSIIFVTGLTAARPGSAEGLQLSVYDIDNTRADLIARGVDVSEPFHDVTGIFRHAGPRGAGMGPRPSMPTTARSRRSPIRTATVGCSRRSRPASPAAEGATHGHDVRIRERPGRGPEARGGGTRTARGANRRGGSGLAGLVRALHGSRARG